MTDYYWYAVINGNEIQQGDFIYDLEVPIVKETKPDEPPVDIATFDAIIMTQSCDILKDAVEQILLCPVWDLKEAAEFNALFADKDYLERVRKDQVLGFYLLNKCELSHYEYDYRIVQFERFFIIPKETIKNIVSSKSTHLRLLPPYREQMAQRFGMCFSRVASPKEIPSFKK